MIKQLSALVGPIITSLCVGDKLMQRLAPASFIAIVLAAVSTARSSDPTPDSSQKAAVHKVIAAVEECFNRGDAKRLAALWTTDGDFVGPSGERIAGSKNVEAAFQEFFAAHKNSKLRLGVVNVRLATADVASVDAIAAMTPAPDDLAGEPRSAILLVLRDGRWLIDSIRETVGAAPSHYGRLKELGWLVGDWASQADSSSAVSVHSTCDWTANGSYLIRKFTIRRKDGVVGGTEVIGWDPRAHRIRSWVFESDGGFGESEWTRNAHGWTIKYKGILADGSDVSATQTLLYVEADTLTLESTGRTTNGQKQPDLARLTVKRLAASEQPTMKPNKPAQPPRQVLP
jgi:uncharacterized protein (TIGR02246 family)